VIKSIATVRHLRVLGFAVGAVAIAAGALWITASAAGLNVGLRSSTSTPPQSTNAGSTSPQGKAGGTSAACTDFDAAFQRAVGQTLDDEVKNGDITQAQADAIKKKVAGQAPCALLPSSASKPPASNQDVYRQMLFSAAASALGITDQQLKADLAQGMTLSQIAAAQSPPVTEAEFRARLIARLTPLLDAAVANKKLTSAQEQAIIKQLQTGPIPYWNTPIPGTKPGATTATPTPTP
jgi:hypothetical protein